jgi:hypothetical protein
MDTQTAFANAFDMNVKLVSVFGQCYMAWLIATVAMPGEIFTGRQSPRAQRAIQAVQESVNGGHKVITAAFGRG